LEYPAIRRALLILVNRLSRALDSFEGRGAMPATSRLLESPPSPPESASAKRNIAGVAVEKRESRVLTGWQRQAPFTGQRGRL